MKQKRAAWGLQKELKKRCKYTHVNEMKRCAATQAKCIWKKKKQQPFQLVGSASTEKEKRGERGSLKKIHLHIFQFNGPSESAYGNRGWAMQVRVLI